LKARLGLSCNPSDRVEIRDMLFSRRTRFFILEKILLPLAIFPFRLLLTSWRPRAPDEKTLQQVAATAPLFLVTYHGMLLHLLAFARFSPRRLVVMVSPSYDGRLLGAFLRHFGIAHVLGSSRSRNVAGSLEFIRRVKAGEIGLIAVDGPRGPCCVAKPGFLKMASAAGAHLLVVTTTASRGMSLKTWDRAHLPAPFAALKLSLQLLPPPDTIDPERELSVIQELLVSSARKIGSPVLQSNR
jgi:lysophospholipid acyltransferase (LPLAT)-like uncharacterized protein